VQAGLARHLGIQPMRAPARTLGDHLAKNICVLGLIAATASKIARGIYTLMKTEYSEAKEPVPPGTFGDDVAEAQPEALSGYHRRGRRSPGVHHG
jgi:3-carboxy-cis,cis-muconate cycloisomerase